MVAPMTARSAATAWVSLTIPGSSRCCISSPISRPIIIGASAAGASGGSMRPWSDHAERARGQRTVGVSVPGDQAIPSLLVAFP